MTKKFYLPSGSEIRNCARHLEIKIQIYLCNRYRERCQTSIQNIFYCKIRLIPKLQVTANAYQVYIKLNYTNIYQH